MCCFFGGSWKFVEKIFKNVFGRVCFRFQMLIMLLMAVFQSKSNIPLQIIFHFTSHSFIHAIQFVNKKNDPKDIFVGCKSFFRSKVSFCSHFLRSDDFNKITKRSLNTLTLNLSYMWVWSLLIYLSLFGPFICNNV